MEVMPHINVLSKSNFIPKRLVKSNNFLLYLLPSSTYYDLVNVFYNSSSSYLTIWNAWDIDLDSCVVSVILVIFPSK